MRLIERVVWERSSEDGGVYVCPLDLTDPCGADIPDLIELKKVIDESLKIWEQKSK